MSKALRTGSCVAVAVAIAVMAGCEWDMSGDGDSSWNDRYNWVNFSGVYRAVGGGILITDFTAGAAATSGGQTNTVTVPVSSETIGTGDNGSVYNGTLANTPILAGSVQITAGGFNLVDNGSEGLSDAPATGNVDYDSGAWSVNLAGNIVAAGQDLVARYSYISGGSTSGSSQSQASSRGTSGNTTIYSWVVHQEGNKLTITDNYGAVYNGQFGSMRTSAGVSQDDAAAAGGFTPADGEQIIAQFTASGRSAGNANVKIVGSFEGQIEYPPASAPLIVDQDTTQVYFMERRMQATWIEEGGVSADIIGAAGPAPVIATRTYFEDADTFIQEVNIDQQTNPNN